MESKMKALAQHFGLVLNMDQTGLIFKGPTLCPRSTHLKVFLALPDFVLVPPPPQSTLKLRKN